MLDIVQNVAAAQIYVFILIFVRVGTAFMIMPTMGDSFVSANIRLLFALGFSVLVTPALAPHLPTAVEIGNDFLLLIIMEVVIGVFIGTIARSLIATLDIAGMLISSHGPR